MSCSDRGKRLDGSELEDENRPAMIDSGGRGAREMRAIFR